MFRRVSPIPPCSRCFFVVVSWMRERGGSVLRLLLLVGGALCDVLYSACFSRFSYVQICGGRGKWLRLLFVEWSLDVLGDRRWMLCGFPVARGGYAARCCVPIKLIARVVSRLVRLSTSLEASNAGSGSSQSSNAAILPSIPSRKSSESVLRSLHDAQPAQRSLPRIAESTD
jgi:hypothetical protein